MRGLLEESHEEGLCRADTARMSESHDQAPYVVRMILHVTAITQGRFTSGYGGVPDVSRPPGAIPGASARVTGLPVGSSASSWHLPKQVQHALCPPHRAAALGSLDVPRYASYGFLNGTWRHAGSEGHARGCAGYLHVRWRRTVSRTWGRECARASTHSQVPRSAKSRLCQH